MIKIIKYFFQSIIVYLFYLIGKIIGLNFSRKIFSNLFLLVGPFFKSRKIIDKNLYIFNKNISVSQKKRIVSNMWKNYGKTFIEYIFLNLFRNSSTHVKILGNNILNEKKQRIFISGHFANFELMSMEITKQNTKLATIYRPLNNLFLNPLMEFLRKKYVCKNQIKKGINGVRDAIEYVKKDYSIALMIDQRVSEGEKIELFGKDALTTTLPAQLAFKYNLPLVPVYIERSENDKFILKFHEEIKPNDYKNKTELTKKLNSILEKMIISNPDQWIWTHNRWK
tara:strand:+ start:220 stop:1065 length:846 start_codon:yes stop_codon:yes gene_type:complete